MSTSSKHHTEFPSGMQNNTAPEHDATAMNFEPDSYFGLDIPFMRYIGLRAEALDADFARTHLPFSDKLVNSRGDVHGGTLMSVLDFTLSAAARAHDPLGLGIATIEMSTHFLDIAKTDLTFEARVLRRGRSIAFCEGTAYDTNNVAVCTARATFRLIQLNRD